jgi:hypothetical protein
MDMKNRLAVIVAIAVNIAYETGFAYEIYFDGINYDFGREGWFEDRPGRVIGRIQFGE